MNSSPHPFFRFPAAPHALLPPALVVRRLAGIRKEMFTIAETYIISIDEKVSEHKTNIMLLAVELSIDTIN